MVRHGIDPALGMTAWVWGFEGAERRGMGIPPRWVRESRRAGIAPAKPCCCSVEEPVMRIHTLFGMLCVVFVAVACRPVLAGPADDAAKLFADGKAMLAKDDFDGALAAYAAAAKAIKKGGRSHAAAAEPADQPPTEAGDGGEAKTE